MQLVLERAQRRRSLFVWTRKGARTLVFWRSERSMRSTRPGVRAPTARGLDGPLTIVVDERERHAWRFADRPDRASLERLHARSDADMSVTAHAERHGVSAATASNDLRELERRGVLQASGNKRSLGSRCGVARSDRTTHGSARR